MKSDVNGWCFIQIIELYIASTTLPSKTAGVVTFTFGVGIDRPVTVKNSELEKQKPTY